MIFAKSFIFLKREKIFILNFSINLYLNFDIDLALALNKSLIIFHQSDNLILDNLRNQTYHFFVRNFEIDNEIEKS